MTENTIYAKIDDLKERINNQWGLGSESISTSPTENLEFLKEDIKEII